MSKGKKAKILIVGFGNVGHSVLQALPEYSDMECIGIVTRRPKVLAGKITDIPIFDMNGLVWRNCGADVAVLCGGSKSDLMTQGPMVAKCFNTVCSFDTHAKIGDILDSATGKKTIGYYDLMNLASVQNGNTAMICQGWDPGVFSLMRALFNACLGKVRVYAFYGLSKKGGVSMGHSQAIRSIEGVLDARSYTHAIPEAIEWVRSGKNPDLKDGDMHWRENVVVAKEGADLKLIETQIATMPNYFAPFKTTVRFITQNEMDKEHTTLPHDGLVLAVSKHGIMEFGNTWSSNPRGTAGIMLPYVRAAIQMNKGGRYGAFTSLDVPVRMLLKKPGEFLSFV